MNNMTGINFFREILQSVNFSGALGGNNNLLIGVKTIVAVGALLIAGAAWKYRAKVLQPENPADFTARFFRENHQAFTLGGVGWENAVRRFESQFNWLVFCGASVNAQNAQGRTAADIIRNRFSEARPELSQFIAKKS